MRLLAENGARELAAVDDRDVHRLEEPRRDAILIGAWRQLRIVERLVLRLDAVRIEAATERELVRDRELIVTSNGRPVAVLSTADEESVEETLAAFRQARASRAVLKAQTRSVRTGKSRLSAAEIDKEIAAVRARRKG